MRHLSLMSRQGRRVIPMDSIISWAALQRFSEHLKTFRPLKLAKNNLILHILPALSAACYFLGFCAQVQFWGTFRNQIEMILPELERRHRELSNEPSWASFRHREGFHLHPASQGTFFRHKYEVFLQFLNSKNLLFPNVRLAIFIMGKSCKVNIISAFSSFLDILLDILCLGLCKASRTSLDILTWPMG